MKIKCFYISGPQDSSLIVFKLEIIEDMIVALADLDGNDPDDYTSTEIEIEL